MNPVPISQLEAKSAFLDYIREITGNAPEAIREEGVIQRFSTNGKRGDLAGWCIWYGQTGAFGNWRTGESHTWRSDQYQRLTKTERQRIDRQIRQAEAQRQYELEAGYQHMAEQARADIQGFCPATADHPYLREKGIQPHGALIDGQNVLIIPMYHRGEIVSYQRIYPVRLPDGTNKRFLKGGRKKGCYHPIGNKGTGDLGVCEGFATGASIHEATGDDVVVAFDAGNLLPVARAMRDKYPGRKIILWADDDYRRVDRNGQPENIGVIKATEAAQAINGYLAVPDFGEKRPEGATDFNDLHQMMRKGGQAMIYETSQNGQDMPQVQTFATAIPAISATEQMEQIALNSTMTSGTDLWPDPQPLENREAPEPYPVNALPETIRNAVIEAQAFYQAPVPLIAASALGALSLAIQGHIDVERAGKLTGPTSLYSLVIARSGERKTSCDRHFMKTIHDHVQELEKQTEPELVKWGADYRAWQAEIKGLETRITALSRDPKGKPDDLEKAKNDLRVLEASEPAKPLEPRMIYTDFTPEVLGFNLATGYPTAGVISSEAGTVFGSHGMGKDSIMRNLALINQLWDGAAVRVDRRTSDSFTISGARLTVSLQVQQEALQEFYEKNGELARGSGFMARFLISAPQSTQGTRLFRDEPDTWPALEKFNDRLKAILLDALPMTEKCRLEPCVMTFPPEVKTLWVSQYNAIEKAMGNGGKLEDINDMASKAADNIARLAALFHYFEHGKTPICEDCLNRAATIVLWYLNEAKRFFNDIATPPEQIRLKKLDKWMIGKAQNERTHCMRQNHILQYGPIRKSEPLDEALETLQELDRIRIDRSGNAKRVIINPKLTMF